MSVCDVLLGVWQNGGQVVVLGGAGWALASARAAPSAVKANDLRIEALSRDLRRWMHDSDRVLSERLALIAAYARNPDLEGQIVEELVALRAPVPEELKHLPAGSQYDSGAHLQWRAGAQGAVLHQYRDRATQTLDQFDEIVGAEGWWHRITRKRLRRCRPAVVLAGAELEILARWRADVTLEDLPSASVNDVSRPELEPALRRLEDRGAGSCVSVG